MPALPIPSSALSTSGWAQPLTGRRVVPAKLRSPRFGVHNRTLDASLAASVHLRSLYDPNRTFVVRGSASVRLTALPQGEYRIAEMGF